MFTKIRYVLQNMVNSKKNNKRVLSNNVLIYIDIHAPVN